MATSIVLTAYTYAPESQAKTGITVAPIAMSLDFQRGTGQINANIGASATQLSRGLSLANVQFALTSTQVQALQTLLINSMVTVGVSGTDSSRSTVSTIGGTAQ